MGISTPLAQNLILKIGSILEEMGLSVVYRQVPNRCEIVMFHDESFSEEEARENNELYRIVIGGLEEDEDEEELDWLWEVDPELAETYFWGLSSAKDQGNWLLPLKWASQRCKKDLPLRITKKLHVTDRRTKHLKIKNVMSKKFPSVIKIQRFIPSPKKEIHSK
tara:strand:+ start:865 stop:1356 length:492 start_codon:yes stop_codon:yes gene_type:complete